MELFLAAEKYEIADLLNVCGLFMVENLTEKNAVELLITTYLCDQKQLFRRASEFIIDNQIQNKVFDSEHWKNLEEKSPALALKLRDKAHF